MVDSITRSGVYCIRSTVSGRVYVGSAVDVRRRWSVHRWRLSQGTHHSVLLQRSWNKHGAGAFVFDVIEAVKDKSLLVGLEQHWIDKLKSCCPRSGFNIAPRAGSSLGRKHPPEVLAKMRAAQVGRKKAPFTDEHRAAIRASRLGNQWGKGIPKSADHRAKISSAKKGKKARPFTKKHRANLGDAVRAARKRKFWSGRRIVSCGSVARTPAIQATA